MRYLIFLIWSCTFALMGFSQSSQTVALVFVSSGNESSKNYEAVIDDISYFSTSNYMINSQQTSERSQNAIWLDNFLPGKHTIEVYNIRKGSREERAGNSLVYSSTFTVKEGLDTKIAIKTNGHVQVSEKLNNSVSKPNSNIKENGGTNSTGKNVYQADPKTSVVRRTGSENDDFENNYKKKQFTPASADENDENISVDKNLDGHERHSRKRLDTAVVYNNVKNDNPLNASTNSKGRSRSEIRNSKSSSRVYDQHKDNNSKLPMNEDQFHELYESVRNQWLPGQKMKTLSNEFLNAEDNFSTAQAKQLIKLLTEEGNRLKLAKAVYPCITDPENFSDLDTLLRYKTSKAELDNFVSEGGKE